MSRRRNTTAGDVAIDRATVALMSKQTWPDDCPECATRMQFDTAVEGHARRVCPGCGTSVEFVRGKLAITTAREQATIAGNLRTTPDNVRVLLAI